MNKLRVYHITFNNDLGAEVILEPRVPKCIAEDEDKVTPRICVAPTILGCFRAHGIPLSKVLEPKYTCYYADIDVGDLYAPSIEEVPDVCITGELWVMKPHLFKILTHYEMKYVKGYPEDKPFFMIYDIIDVDYEKDNSRESYSVRILASIGTADLAVLQKEGK